MSPEVLSILGVGVSLAALVLAGQRSLRAEINSVRAQLQEGLAAASAEINSVRAEINSVRAEINSVRTQLQEGLAAASAERGAIRTEIRADLRALAERVARLEGAFPFFAARFRPEPQPDEPTA